MTVVVVDPYFNWYGNFKDVLMGIPKSDLLGAIMAVIHVQSNLDIGLTLVKYIRVL